MKRLGVALAGALLLAGCTTVPEESQPEVIPQEQPAQSTPEVPQPATNIDALTVVRDFVHASAKPLGDNAAARVYLQDAAQKSWRPGKGLTIIEDTFATVYANPETQSPDPNEQVVVLRGVHMGRLGPDSAFGPSKEPYVQPVRVRKQSDGQWRIVDPPANMVTTSGDFTANYSKVPVLFLAADSNSLAPDLRYVPANPQAARPSKVLDLLLSGPSKALTGAVRNPLGENAAVETSVTMSSDGALVVPLSGVDGQSFENKKLIAAQIVLSLQDVTSSRIRLLSDGAPLIPGHEDWRSSDLPNYASPVSVSSELPGLVTVAGRVRSLGGGGPVPGPVGSGAYQVLSAGQSLDGKQLAVVEREGERVRLRVGDYGRPAQPVDLTGRSLSRPTWRPTPVAGAGSSELWTVLDGAQVLRVLRTPTGSWVPQPVNAVEVAALGPIDELRLSRDGTRAAVVAGGQLAVTSVVRTSDSVTLGPPMILGGGELRDVRDVDWLNQDTVVASTASASTPVVRLPVDGLRIDQFNSSNLTPPVHGIAAARGRPVVVADAGGLWTASNAGEVWQPHPYTQRAHADPFYPG